MPTPIARYSLTALDCPDPRRLAEFYSELTGWPVDEEHDDPDDDPGEWVQLEAPNGATIAFQRAPGHRPPVWPSDDHPQQAHLDFDVPDLDAGEEAVLRLGAVKTDAQPGDNWRVFLDPAGHPFCLVLRPGLDWS